MTLSSAYNGQTRLNVRGANGESIITNPHPAEFSSEIIKTDNSLHKFLKDQTEIFMVMYCTNPKEILTAFGWGNLNYLEVVIGHKKVQNFKKALTPGVLHQLSTLIDEGKLVIFTSDTIHYHSKLYVCHNENGARLINGSANFTRTGTGIKGRQWNDIWVWDITGDYVSSPIYKREISKYNIYKSNVEVFIENDLASVFANEENEKKRVEMMENWLKTDMIHGSSGDTEVRELTRLINKRVMEGDAEVIEIMPPQSDATVKRVAEDMAQLGIQLTGDSTIQVIRSDYLNHKVRPFPMMDVDFDLREVRIGIGNEVINRTANHIDIELMEQDIIRFEEFIDTVEMTDFRDLRLAKMALFEAMLYILCTPFHNEFMERRRRIFGIAEERGPRILHLWGNTYNGKSKFLNVASKFLTGSKIIKPRDAEHFVQKEVRSVQLMQTAYPQMYDDLTKDKWTADGTEKIVKTIWDKKWRPGEQQSQVILTSNRKCPDGQMKTRVKEIHFPATFERSKESRMALLQHLEGDCEFFTWFSKLYFDYALDNPDHIEDDESFIGRVAMSRMYELCDRELPDWFCSEPLEHLYDKTAIEILKALARKDGWFKDKSGEFQIIFKEQIEWWEVSREYKNGIPPECNAEQIGNTVFIRSKDRFLNWLAKSMRFYEHKGTLPWRYRRMLDRY